MFILISAKDSEAPLLYKRKVFDFFSAERRCVILKRDGLLIFNCQTNEEYMNGDTLISRNTAVLLQRVPPAWPIPPIYVEKEKGSVTEDPTSCLSTSNMEELSDLTCGDFGDDPFSPVITDKQNSQLVESKSAAYSIADIERDKKDVGNGPMFATYLSGVCDGRKRKVPPIGYICHRCETPGHFIHHCPTNSDHNYDNKRIRRSMLNESSKGSYLLPNSPVSALQHDHTTFLREMVKMPTTTTKQSSRDIPLGLRCPLCCEVMKDASIALKCCMNTFCYKCIRDQIVKNKMCQCGASNALVENLKPNGTIRELINELLSWSACTTTNSSTITSLSMCSNTQ